MVFESKNIDYLKIKENIDRFLEYNFSISPKSEKQVEQLKKEIRIWEEKIIDFFNNEFYPSSDVFIDMFGGVGYIIMDEWKVYSLQKMPFVEREYEKLKWELEEKKSSLQPISDYILMTDVLQGKENKYLATIQEKTDFLLEKLRLVFNDKYYSISQIFELNSIEYRSDEPFEIARLLEKKGYVISKRPHLNIDMDKVKLSVKGATYIERKLKIKNKTEINKDIDTKLNDIIDRLQKLGYGQEIIFDEIEELRGLTNKMSKKSWGQLLKGKLIDLMLSEIINKDVAISIFEYLTNSHFKMLK